MLRMNNARSYNLATLLKRHERINLLQSLINFFPQSSKGLWAGHWWESSAPTRINSGSSFLKRISADEVVERTDAEFQEIAVDILTGDPPSGVFREFESLKDVAEDHDNPFGDGGDVKIFIITRSKR
jgi:hypothetical protein